MLSSSQYTGGGWGFRERHYAAEAELMELWSAVEKESAAHAAAAETAVASPGVSSGGVHGVPVGMRNRLL